MGGTVLFYDRRDSGCGFYMPLNGGKSYILGIFKKPEELGHNLKLAQMVHNNISFPSAGIPNTNGSSERFKPLDRRDFNKVMKVLKGVLSESWDYYQNLKAQIEARVKSLPKGSVKKRALNGKNYYYLQYRDGSKVIQKYAGKARPEKLEKQILERRSLQHQLREVLKSLKLLSKVRPIL